MAITRLQTLGSSADRAAEALRREILSGTIAPGDKLPPERELAESLGISRLTLRAGLATLVRDGLVRVRHGSGSYVRDFHEGGGPDLLGDLADLSLAQIAPDLLRVRRHLAAAALEAIAERRPGARARRPLARAVAELARAADAGVGPDDFAPLDLETARALVAATGSPALRLCLNPVIAVVAGSAPLRAAMYADPRANAIGWRGLLAWVEDPHPAAIPALLAVLAERDRGTIRRLRGAP